MRRLLLLLLTFLLPLQLLAATVVDLPLHVVHATQGQGTAASGHLSCQPQQIAASERNVADLSPLHASMAAAGAAALSDSGAGQDGDEDDGAAPAVQAELEDHTIPARIATPDIPWQPFPHAFSTPLSWASFVRDQLRPPPLA